MGDADSVVKFISGLGVTGVLIVLIYGLLKGWFVTGREHGVLVGLYQSVQNDMTAMREELKSLRDRDTSQQVEINTLKAQLVEEQSLKLEALRRVAELTAQVQELQRQVSGRASNNTA